MVNYTNRLAAQTLLLLGLFAATSNASAQNWKNQANMKVARVEATTVDYRDDIYVFNGFKAGLAIADSVEKFDSATKQWKIISNTSTMIGNAVTHNGVVRVGADVWIIGGRVGRHPGRVTDKVWIYNLNTNKWRRGPDLKKPGAAGGAALVNNKIHWFGGLDTNASCDVNNHVVYDLSKPGAGWQDITGKAAMPTPRNHFSTAVVNGIIYAMGGQFGHDNCPGKRTNDTTLVHAFNPKTNTWAKKADMPNLNSHSEPGTFVYKGDIYTTGGENAKNKVWKYNPRTNKWSTFKILRDELVAPIARIVDGQLIVAGGGAPIAQQATNKVRSLLVDNNPPAVAEDPVVQPVSDPEPEPQPEPTPVPGSHRPAGPTLISMEAEYFDLNDKTSSHQWIHATKGDSSNDDAMITTPDEGALAGSASITPMLSYMVNFNHTGKHYIWVRGLGDTNASGVGNSDSIQVGLNGSLSSTAYRIDNFPDQWTWSRQTPSSPVATLNVVSAGVNMVNFWMREDGLAFDKFVITSDPNFVPTGHGPEITDGSADYVPPIADPETPDVAVVPDTLESPDMTVVPESPVVSETEVPETVDASEATDVLHTETNNTDVTDTSVSSEDASHAGESGGTLIDFRPMPPVKTLIGEDDQTSGDEITLEDTTETLSAVASANSSSRGGLFGGSSSLAGLLMLLSLWFIRRKQID